MSFTTPFSPLTAIVIGHIVYINESNPYTPLVFSVTFLPTCFQWYGASSGCCIVRERVLFIGIRFSNLHRSENTLIIGGVGTRFSNLEEPFPFLVILLRLSFSLSVTTNRVTGEI